MRGLAVGANAAVVFREYSLSPEAKYPTAIEESFAVARWVATLGASRAWTDRVSPSPGSEFIADGGLVLGPVPQHERAEGAVA